MEKISRRRMLKNMAAASAFYIVPRHVLGGPGYQAPSDTLNIAGIGVGGMGGADLRELESENIVALCDVDHEYAAHTFKRYPKAKIYKDYRVMLEKQKDIDAVVVATPDHMHAPITMAAIRAGKHVYTEKPLTHTIKEARLVTQAAREAKVATQMGTQGHAMEEARLLCEWIWDGAIGDVYEVHAWTTHPVWPQGIARPKEAPKVPKGLDWDLWIGVAPYRPYHPVYHPGQWRGWYDFGTGGLGDMGCHIFDPIVWALKLGHPISVEASQSMFVPKGLNWDKPKNTDSYPQATLVHYKFPAREGMPPLTLHWYDGGLMPETPEELEEGRKMGDQFGGVLYIGTKGKILTGSHGARGVRIIPESKMAEYRRPPKTLPRSVGHHREWINACKGGEAAGMNFEKAGPLTEIVLLGVLALRFDKKLIWDPETMRFPNCQEADAFVHKEYRAGWSL
ncbi:MAG: Gfo/Idh/MocA family oxidoreductase [candidate division KSB1 bacterium]|nr:Gfo/Idh/MocA family oxidoreductase [candidate division KSB1 bacterium]